jgi:hypothetical protein
MSFRDAAAARESRSRWVDGSREQSPGGVIAAEQFTRTFRSFRRDFSPNGASQGIS